MTKEKIFSLFLQDMKQPAIQLALQVSFTKYARKRDQLIREYSQITGIPEDEFHSQIATETIDDLVSVGPVI